LLPRYGTESVGITELEGTIALVRKQDQRHKQTNKGENGREKTESFMIKMIEMMEQETEGRKNRGRQTRRKER
jgi:hypothetical protein